MGRTPARRPPPRLRPATPGRAQAGGARAVRGRRASPSVRRATSRGPGHSLVATAGPVTRGSLAPARPSVAHAQPAAQPTVPHRPGRSSSLKPASGAPPAQRPGGEVRVRSAPRARQPNPVPGRAARRREPGQAASPHTRGGGGAGGGGSSALPLRGGAGAGPPADWSAGSDGQPACPVSPFWPPRAGPRAAPTIVGPTFVPAQWPVWPWGGPVIRSSPPGLSIHCKPSSGLRLCPLPGPVSSAPHAASPRGRTRAQALPHCAPPVDALRSFGFPGPTPLVFLLPLWPLPFDLQKLLFLCGGS